MKQLAFGAAAAAVTLFLTVPAAGQAGGSLTLTLDDAVTRGLARSHRLGEARARIEAAEAAEAARRAATRPLVSFQGGYQRTNHVEEFGVLLPTNQLRIIYPDIPDNFRTRLDGQWPVWDSGRSRLLEGAAAAEAAAVRADADGTEADLRFEIARAYWEFATAIEAQRAVDQGVTRLEAHLRDARNQLEAGLVAPNEVLIVEAQRSRQHMLSVQARLARELAEANLARLVDAAPGTVIVPATPAGPAAPNAWMADAVYQQALEESPVRRALADRIRAAEARTASARAALKPTVAVGAGFDYARPNPRIFPREREWAESWDVGVSIHWPLLDGGRAAAAGAEAEASTRALRERLAEIDSLLAVESRQRVNDLAESRAVVDAAEAALASAAEAVRVAGDRFRAGVATSTAVLDAELALQQAELDRTRALTDARLAEARLLRTIGR